MAATQPTGEQLRFRSANTGDHILDTYFEACEIGGRPIYDLLDDIFDVNGVFDSSMFEMRFKGTTGTVQWRIGTFADPEAGWADLVALFDITGAFNSGTTYHNFDFITDTNTDVYIVHGLTSSGTTFADVAAMRASGNTTKIFDIATANQHRIDAEAARDAAAASETAAGLHETAAATSETNAAASETASLNNKNYSEEWANAAEDTLVSAAAGGNQTDEYSAKHHAAKAAASEASAAADAATATTKAGEASASATAAANSADEAQAAASSVTDVVVLKGTWAANAGTFPGGGTDTTGDSYIVNVAGTVDGVDFEVDDRIVAIVDNASTTTYANNWHKLDYTDKVASVAGKSGVVTLEAADIASGTLADARVAQSNVTQWQASLVITESQVSDLGNYALAGHTHPISDITSLQSTLDSKLPLAGGSMTGKLDFQYADSGASFISATGSLAKTEHLGDANNGAFTALHRAGAFAIYFGLDTDNRIKAGGWSAGANEWFSFGSDYAKLIGDLGIGCTPSAWGSSGQAVQLEATSSVYGHNDNSMHINANCYFDGSNWRYVENGDASNIYLYAGKVKFRHAPSGTAGNVITWVETGAFDQYLTELGNPTDNTTVRCYGNWESHPIGMGTIIDWDIELNARSVSGNVTFTETNKPLDGYSRYVAIEINYTSGTITWPATWKFEGGTPPTLDAGINTIVGYCRDGVNVRAKKVNNGAFA